MEKILFLMTASLLICITSVYGAIYLIIEEEDPHLIEQTLPESDNYPSSEATVKIEKLVHPTSEGTMDFLNLTFSAIVLVVMYGSEYYWKKEKQMRVHKVSTKNT